jgi:hypothetical protein
LPIASSVFGVLAVLLCSSGPLAGGSLAGTTTKSSGPTATHLSRSGSTGTSQHQAAAKPSTPTPKAAPAAASPSAPAPPPAPSAPSAPRYAPFSEFTVLTPGELLSLRFKLTRLGGADPANAVAVWAANGQVADPAEFIPYRRPGFQYEPANSMPFIFTAESAELQAVVDSVGTLSQVLHGAVESRGALSFAMLVSGGGKARAFETILGPEGARLLMGRMLGALASNVSAVSSLRRFGCAGDLLPENAPIAVDSLARITLTAIKADKASPGEFMSSVVITNISTAPIPGPLSLVIQVDADTKLIGAEGETCRVQPPGTPFVGVSMDALAPGASLRQTLKFWNQTGNRFEPTVRLVAGPGVR